MPNRILRFAIRFLAKKMVHSRSIADYFFLIMGINLNSEDRKIAKIVFFGMAIFEATVLAELARSIFVCDEFENKMKLAGVTIIGSTLIQIKYCLHLTKNAFVYLGRELTNERIMYLLYHNDGKLMKMLSSVLIWICVTLTLCVISCILFVSFPGEFSENVDYNDPTYYLVPEMLKYWNVQSPLGYIIINMLVVLLATPFALLCGGCYVFLIITCYNLLILHGNVENKLATVIELDIGVHRAKVMSRETHYHHAPVDQEMNINFIRYQQYLNRYMDNFTLAQVLVSSVALISFLCGNIVIFYQFHKIDVFSIGGVISLVLCGFSGILFFISSYIAELTVFLNFHFSYGIGVHRLKRTDTYIATAVALLFLQTYAILYSNVTSLIEIKIIPHNKTEKDVENDEIKKKKKECK